MPKGKSDIEEVLAEIKEEAQALAGWDELKVISINKYGTEAVMTTTAGLLKISMRDLFMQYQFQQRVFECFGIVLTKVKDSMYRDWLTIWSKTIKDMGIEYGTTLDIIREALENYLEGAEERDVAYLKKGEPIILPDGVVAFKSMEFSLWLKKKYSMAYSDDQVRAALMDLECKTRQVGHTRVRAWTYRMPKVESYDEPVVLDLKFASKAPDEMADDVPPEDMAF